MKTVEEHRTGEMGLLNALRGDADRTGTLFECRNCGMALPAETGECSECGSTEIARYDI